MSSLRSNAMRKYYKKETFTYWFYSFLPLIFGAETYWYMQVAEVSSDMVIFLTLICRMCEISGIGLVCYQIISQILFKRKLMKLSPEIKADIENEIATKPKKGRFIKTKAVLIYYGMFEKEVLKREEIVALQTNEGMVTLQGRYKTTVNNDHTAVFVRDGRTLRLPRLLVEDDASRELPYNSLIAVFLMGLLYGTMFLYPKLLNTAMTPDPIENLLLRMVLEVKYWGIAICVVAGIGIFAYVLRYRFLPSRDYSDMAVVAGILLLVLSLFILMVHMEKRDTAELARADLASYREGHFEMKESYLYDSTGEWESLKETLGKVPKEDVLYRVEYLKQTKIIVGFEEIGYENTTISK